MTMGGRRSSGWRRRYRTTREGDWLQGRDRRGLRLCIYGCKVVCRGRGNFDRGWWRRKALCLAGRVLMVRKTESRMLVTVGRWEEGPGCVA